VRRQVLAPQVLVSVLEPLLVRRQALALQVLAPERVADVLPRARAEVLCAGPAVAAGQAESQDGPHLRGLLLVHVFREGLAAVAELPA
jgi:hypothetical protein